MKLLRTPISAEVECVPCGRIYEMSYEEYSNNLLNKNLTATSICICPHCGIGVFKLLKINYDSGSC